MRSYGSQRIKDEHDEHVNDENFTSCTARVDLCRCVLFIPLENLHR